eukprot:g81691.t1
MTYPKYCTSSEGSHCVFSEVGRPRNLTANRKSSAYCMDGKFKVLLLCLKAEYGSWKAKSAVKISKVTIPLGMSARPGKNNLKASEAKNNTILEPWGVGLQK